MGVEGSPRRHHLFVEQKRAFIVTAKREWSAALCVDELVKDGVILRAEGRTDTGVPEDGCRWPLGGGRQLS